MSIFFKDTKTNIYFRNLIFTQSHTNTRNIEELELIAEDSIYQPKNNIYRTSITIKDTNGKFLTAGKDYDKDTIMYTYNTRTVLADRTIKEAESNVEDKDIIPAGTVINITVSAKGSCYTKTITGTYRITEKNIAKLSVEIPVQTYTGKEIRPDSEVQVWINKKSNEKLPETEYEIINYINNVNRGTAALTIRGKNNYGGIKTVKFKIAEKRISW